MAKLRTRKWLLSALASLTGLLAVGFYARGAGARRRPSATGRWP